MHTRKKYSVKGPWRCALLAKTLENDRMERTEQIVCVSNLKCTMTILDLVFSKTRLSKKFKGGIPRPPKQLHRIPREKFKAGMQKWKDFN